MRIVARGSSALLPVIWVVGAAGAAPAPQLAPPIAYVGEHEISLEELDVAGGNAIQSAREQLYEARVRALYQLLSSNLIDREASSRRMTVEQLIEAEVTPRVAAITDSEIDALLKSASSSGAPEGRGRSQARVYLGMKHQADAKRSYVTELFEKYRVRIALPAPPPAPPETIRGAVEPALGAPEAPVSIVAFSDYRCPYCRDLSRTLAVLRERYPKQVQIIYRHYALHEDSDALAQAALCAADQGQFETYHDAIFERKAAASDVLAIAQALSLDQTRFQQCVESGQHRERVAADLAEGRRLQITGTPTLFVAGQRLRGAQSLERLSKAVEEALRTRTVAHAGVAPH